MGERSTRDSLLAAKGALAVAHRHTMDAYDTVQLQRRRAIDHSKAEALLVAAETSVSNALGQLDAAINLIAAVTVQ